MNIWSRLLLHLRRARLRQRFMKQQHALQELFRTQLLASGTSALQWHDIEWLTDPILHVVPETEQTPVALVGVAAIYSLEGETDMGAVSPRTHAGTALFYYQNDAWQSHGKVLLNLTPSEALQQLMQRSMTTIL